MSAAAASAAVLDQELRNLVDNSLGETLPDRSPRRLKSVPAPAGPASERSAGNPLSLGRDARTRLSGAVHALLDMAGLNGVSDAVRLAVLVLAARTPSETGVVEIRTRELGRWLGLSASYVASSVLPVLRRSGVVSVDTAQGEYGQDDGLECRVLPLWAAQDVAGHPLNLVKKEYATLLRLLEAVMAPGWTHRDGRVTPAGLIGARTGRGAATDRLALLLLVLEARETGRVRQCGGRVDIRRGRAAATVARLLGCTASAGERVLERLEDRELVRRVRLRTGSGLAGRSRLMVPAVAAAHGRTVADDVQEDHAEVLQPEPADPDVAARPGEAVELETKAQVSGMLATGKADVAEPDAAATLHTDHTHLVPPVPSPALSGGFSGEGRGGEDGLPERGCVREEQAADGKTAFAESAPPAAEDGPLRGEKPEESPVEERDGQRAAGARAGSRPKAAVWGRGQQRRAGLPADLGVRVALSPVAGLWERLSGWQQDQVEAAAKAEIARLAGMLTWPETAPRLLADRLNDRLEEAGGEVLVRDAMAWLLGRGIVQRPRCPDPRCDDGIRLDTRTDCPACASVVADRRSERTRLRSAWEPQLASVPAPCRKAAYEQLLREHTILAETRAQMRRERAADDVARRREAVAERRRTQQAAEQTRRAAPCIECGLDDAAGLCPQCAYRRRTDALVREAVDLAVAVRADLDSADDISALTEQCETDTRTLISETCRAAGYHGELADFIAPDVAERIVGERRASALRRLLVSEEAEAEANAVHDSALRRNPRERKTAQAAAESARRRTAEYLLSRKVGQLHAQRARGAAGRPPLRVT
ncbi:hypothetical protein [Streptomyces sp. NPDC058739]|uniref:hypothetical protein n=1 Tax=Streptomyces sp. NPDC058739 TaxID=3346618 RepID=UPI0036992508